MESIAAHAVCHQLQTANYKTPNKHVLGRSSKIWCPYADYKAILEAFVKERTKAAWRRANEAKRLKKKGHFLFILVVFVAHYAL